MSRRARRGYTTVEVLMAITIMMIGAVAVMSMQKASVQGNLDARKTDVANSIARTWVERVQRESMMWTAPGPSNESGNNMSNLLVIQDGVNKVGTWFRPDDYSGQTPPLSAGFDILGRDIPSSSWDSNPPLFCVHLRFTWLDNPGLLRVDVRVLWARGITTQAEPSAPDNVCADDVSTSNQPDPLAFHAIYLTTAVKGNPQ